MNQFSLVIFGITSNLAQIKLIPALYDLEEKRLLPKEAAILGVARSAKSKAEIVSFVKQTLSLENRHHRHPIKPEVAERLAERFFYLDGELNDPNFYQRLKQELEKLANPNVIFYLATYPNLYQAIFNNLKAHNLNRSSSGWVRLMIEKPIGNDLVSAKALNKLLHSCFDEDQLFRLDHYLGKETLQNILAFRFANGIFEPLINRDYIDHIQITAAEDFGIGKRGGYYDQVGALKDVGQNHLLQMLVFATMENPGEFSNQAVTKERIKVLENLRPEKNKLVFGQYQGYLQEENVDKDSQADTFFALKTELKNPRFQGVPVYIRAGKKLAQTVTEISIVFKIPKNRLMASQECGLSPNVLIYRIQPNEGVVLKILTKEPGSKLMLEGDYMQYCYKTSQLSDPYENLLLDALEGDQTFFNDAQEVEAQWAFVDPLTEAKTKVYSYKPGSWGPKEALELIKADGREWLEPSMTFCRI